MYQSWSPRNLNIWLGAWLVISSFLWRHSPAQFNNAWLVGAAAAMFAAIALRADVIRYLNTVLAIWLFFSCWALPVDSQATFWNNLLVAFAMFGTSLWPRGRGRSLGPVGQGPLSRVGQ
jgi:hypothetical protein